LTKNGYSVGLYTLGCKVSQYETEAIAEAFEADGFTRRDFADECDVYVVNTCTVTAEAGRKCRQVIRRAIKENPCAVVMVIGCHSQTDPEDILSIEGVSYVAGTENKMALPKLAISLLSDRPSATVFRTSDLSLAEYEDMRVLTPPRTRAYVKIEDGCECKCTYCAIPQARGRVRSRQPDSVIEELCYLAERGVREAVLTGIEIASYGRDLGCVTLIELLERIDALHLPLRIRLGSLTPELLREEFVLRLSRLSCITPHFHVSLQSGCDRTLAAMKGRYNTDMVRRSLLRMRELIPHVTFTADIIVGFPDESEEDFCESCRFVEEAKFLDMHIFAYSRRKNTPAATYKNQIPEAVKRERSHRMHELQRRITDELLCRIVERGESLCVLFETNEDGVWSGHTDTYVEACCEFSGDLQAQIRELIPTQVRDGRIFGKIKE
jgi:threonylcarbamoyladenosine tRNA methylthiotransferase MtaB